LYAGQPLGDHHQRPSKKVHVTNRKGLDAIEKGYSQAFWVGIGSLVFLVAEILAPRPIQPVAQKFIFSKR
jgi:hypothetical protein